MMKFLDFWSGLKTKIGLVVTVLSLVLGNHATPDSLTAIFTNIFTGAGSLLAAYGMIMAIVKSFQTPQ